MKQILLTKNKFVIVDDEDYGWLNQWRWKAAKNVNGRYYAKREVWKNNHKSVVLMHRQILGLPKGDGHKVDHINRNSLDNRRCNLRLATNQQNQANVGLQKNNKSGFRGVSLVRGKWHVAIKVNYRKIFLGSFDSPKDAAVAYNAAAVKYFGEFAYLNPV